MPYTMDIETAEGIKQHPFHLGTDRAIAESFVEERLAQPETKSVALRLDGKIERVYSTRGL